MIFFFSPSLNHDRIYDIIDVISIGQLLYKSFLLFVLSLFCRNCNKNHKSIFPSRKCDGIMINYFVICQQKIIYKDVQGNESTDGSSFAVQYASLRHDGPLRAGQTEPHVPGPARRPGPEAALRIRRALPSAQSRIRGMCIPYTQQAYIKDTAGGSEGSKMSGVKMFALSPLFFGERKKRTGHLLFNRPLKVIQMSEWLHALNNIEWAWLISAGHHEHRRFLLSYIFDAPKSPSLSIVLLLLLLSFRNDL